MRLAHKWSRPCLALVIAVLAGAVSTTQCLAQDANKPARGAQRTEKKKPTVKQSTTTATGTSQKSEAKAIQGYRPDPVSNY